MVVTQRGTIPAFLLAILLIGSLSLSLPAQVPASPSPNPQTAMAPTSAPQYVGSDTCKDCHEDQFNQIAKTQHWNTNLSAELPRRARPKSGTVASHVTVPVQRTSRAAATSPRSLSSRARPLKPAAHAVWRATPRPIPTFSARSTTRRTWAAPRATRRIMPRLRSRC